jgi:hypothetical protein
MADDRRAQQATLGCGSLVLIALIVLIFSRPGLGDLEREVHGLRSEVGELRKAVEAQSAEIQALRAEVGKARGKE